LSVRNIIAEIIEIRERRASNSSDSETFQRLSSLEQAFKTAPSNNHENLKYFPIALVATMEGCFRVMISELIDHGQPFIDNCDELLKNHKISFELIRAFQGKQVSIGEFVSHVVSINRLSDINSLLSIVSGREFLKELRNHRSRWDVEVLKKEDLPILFNPDEIYRNITLTFELRHIFCHETATKVKFDYDQIRECFLSVSIFLKASVDYISEIMHPNAPLTQTDMNLDSAKMLDNILNEAIEVKNQLAQKILDEPERITLLESSNEKWLEYMEKFSTFRADAYRGGSICPLIYNTTASALAKNYLQVLKDAIKSVEEY